jgi:hypothetical protein
VATQREQHIVENAKFLFHVAIKISEILTILNYKILIGKSNVILGNLFPRG